MSDSTDPELVRLLDTYRLREYDAGYAAGQCRQARFDAAREAALTARSALLAHIARAYVRRDRLVPDEWDDLDATAVVDLAGPGFDGPIPDDPPDTVPAGYRAARGAAPWRPGMPTPEDAIRRLRDREDG